jgi:SAM-dependent methyltransferase
MPDDASFSSHRREALGSPVRELGLAPDRSAPLTRIGRKAVRWLETLTVDRGLDTEEAAIELEHFHSERIWYEPSGWRFLRRALSKAQVGPEDVFVDFGCGKGRVLLCAARYPFARVVGVEISPRLSEIARRNVERARSRLACQRIEVVTCDAFDFPVPDDMTYAYFFHPFIGDTSRQVLEAIIASIDRRPRHVTLIYALPPSNTAALAIGRFRLVKRIKGGLRHDARTRIHVYSSEPAQSEERFRAEGHA